MMTQLEILNLAYDAALTQWGYYHDRIEDLKKVGKRDKLFELIKEEWRRKVAEISGMITKEGLKDGLKEGDEKVKEVTTAFAKTL